MRIAWVNPSFLEYRVPVYEALDSLCDGQLTVICSAERTPPEVVEALTHSLPGRVRSLRGEAKWSMGAGADGFANQSISVPFQRGLLDEIEKARPDVLVGEGFFQWTPAAVAWRILRGTGLVISYERWRHTERGAGVTRTAYRRAIGRLSDAVCCNGSLSREYCEDVLGIASASIFVGGMPSEFRPLRPEEVRSRRADAMRRGPLRDVPKPVFLCVGRLTGPKGIPQLLSAWRTYEAEMESPGSLVLVGAGPLLADLAAGAEAGRSRAVHVLGRISHSEMGEIYSGADVLVMPTLEDNWSLVVAEAMAFGLPLICSKYNGCFPELVRNGVNGWVIDPLDESGFAKALLDAHVARERLEGMGQRSLEIVGDFSPERAAEALAAAADLAYEASRSRGD